MFRLTAFTKQEMNKSANVNEHYVYIYIYIYTHTSIYTQQTQQYNGCPMALARTRRTARVLVLVGPERCRVRAALAAMAATEAPKFLAT